MTLPLHRLSSPRQESFLFYILSFSRYTVSALSRSSRDSTTSSAMYIFFTYLEAGFYIRWQ